MTSTENSISEVKSINKKRRLTDQEKSAAANLKAIWDRRKGSGERLVQKKAAEALDVNQSMISHYLNGVTPLGTEAIMDFALYLGVSPTDIDPEFKFASLVPGDLPKEAVEVAVGWMDLPPKMKKTIRELILSARNGEAA